MTLKEKSDIRKAMKYPLLLDRWSGVYWDFDFNKEEFRVGTACNTGLLVDFTVKYDRNERLDDQLRNLIEKAEEIYDDKEKSFVY